MVHTNFVNLWSTSATQSFIKVYIKNCKNQKYEDSMPHLEKCTVFQSQILCTILEKYLQRILKNNDNVFWT